MAHFAELDENNKVLRVIAVSNDDCGDLEFPESEPIGQAFIASLGIEGAWKQTSYNATFRQFYAGIGCVYLPEEDVFTSPPPFPSWTLDTNNEWQSPTPKPDADGFWYWDEATQQWVR
jgi:hypothetical protein